MWYDDDQDEDYSKLELFSNDERHRVKLSLPPDVHLPNKNEAKLLRKLKSQTGLSEKEIRSKHKYRKMLSEASKAQGTKTHEDRYLNAIVKKITKELKLPRKHPAVVKEFRNKIEEIRVHSNHHGLNWRYRNLRSLPLNYIMKNLELI